MQLFFRPFRIYRIHRHTLLIKYMGFNKKKMLYNIYKKNSTRLPPLLPHQRTLSGKKYDIF